MYCKFCQTEFEWKERSGNRNRLLESSLCDSCLKAVENNPFNKRPERQFCVECGDDLQPLEIVDCNGTKYKRFGNKRHCEACKALKILYKFVEPRRISSESHRKAAIRWQKNNPEKRKAAQLARYHSHKTEVLYECVCDTPDKHNHHFDYDRPFEVIKLCPTCHRKEHERLRKLERLSLA